MVARVHICFGAGLLAFAMLASLAFAEPQPVAVSFEQLEKVPWKFNGRRVSVTGYLDVDAEFRASSAGPSRPGDTIFVDMTPAQAEGLAHMPVKRCEKRYIHIVGTFQHVSLKSTIVRQTKDMNIVSQPQGFGGGLASQITHITEFTPILK